MNKGHGVFLQMWAAQFHSVIQRQLLQAYLRLFKRAMGNDKRKNSLPRLLSGQL